MIRRVLIIFGIILGLLCMSIFASISYMLISWGYVKIVAYDGTYQGRIVDADTGEPLEGVVVLGVWHKQGPSPGGAVTSYYDAREAVTDKNGDFSIRGQGLRVMSNLLPMRPIIFKAGYEYTQFFWHTLKKSQGRRMKVTWDGKIPVIPLRKLSPEEKRNDLYIPPGPPSDAPFEKVKFYLKEVDKYRIERGWKPRKEWGGVKYEID